MTRVTSQQPLSEARAQQRLAELDAELARIDKRLEERRRQHAALEELRTICEPHARENPQLTIAEAVALNRRAR